MDWIAYYQTPEGQALYQRISEADGDVLRIHPSSEEQQMIAPLATLYHVRSSGLRKIPMAREMLMTRRGYEQSTSWSIAKYKAQRCSKGGKVLVGCAGIGMELLAILHHANEIHVVDIDHEMIAVAQYNVLALFPEYAHKVKYHCCDLMDYLEVTTIHFDVAYVDPDRRDDHSRRVSVNDYQPPVHPLIKALATVTERWYIKLSPMVPMDELHAMGCQLIFIEEGNVLKEIMASNSESEWELVQVEGKQSFRYSKKRIVGAPVYAGVVESLSGWYVMLPTPTVRRAGYVDTLCLDLEACKTQHATSLLLSKTLPDEKYAHWVDTWMITAVYPYHKKRLRTVLRKLDIQRAIIKTRDFPMEPHEVLKQLGIKQGGDDILLFSTIGETLVMVVAKDAALHQDRSS